MIKINKFSKILLIFFMILSVAQGQRLRFMEQRSLGVVECANQTAPFPRQDTQGAGTCNDSCKNTSSNRAMYPGTSDIWYCVACNQPNDKLFVLETGDSIANYNGGTETVNSANESDNFCFNSADCPNLGTQKKLNIDGVTCSNKCPANSYGTNNKQCLAITQSSTCSVGTDSIYYSSTGPEYYCRDCSDDTAFMDQYRTANSATRLFCIDFAATCPDSGYKVDMTTGTRDVCGSKAQCLDQLSDSSSNPVKFEDTNKTCFSGKCKDLGTPLFMQYASSTSTPVECNTCTSDFYAREASISGITGSKTLSITGNASSSLAAVTDDVCFVGATSCKDFGLKKILTTKECVATSVCTGAGSKVFDDAAEDYCYEFDTAEVTSACSGGNYHFRLGTDKFSCGACDSATKMLEWDSNISQYVCVDSAASCTDGTHYLWTPDSGLKRCIPADKCTRVELSFSDVAKFLKIDDTNKTCTSSKCADISAAMFVDFSDNYNEPFKCSTTCNNGTVASADTDQITKTVTLTSGASVAISTITGEKFCLKSDTKCSDLGTSYFLDFTTASTTPTACIKCSNTSTSAAITPSISVDAANKYNTSLDLRDLADNICFPSAKTCKSMGLFKKTTNECVTASQCSTDNLKNFTDTAENKCESNCFTMSNTNKYYDSNRACGAVPANCASSSYFKFDGTDVHCSTCDSASERLEWNSTESRYFCETGIIACTESTNFFNAVGNSDGFKVCVPDADCKRETFGLTGADILLRKYDISTKICSQNTCASNGALFLTIGSTGPLSCQSGCATGVQVASGQQTSVNDDRTVTTSASAITIKYNTINDNQCYIADTKCRIVGSLFFDFANSGNTSYKCVSSCSGAIVPSTSVANVLDAIVISGGADKVNATDDNVCFGTQICKDLGTLFFDETATTEIVTNCINTCPDTSSIIPSASRSKIANSKEKGTTTTKLNTIDDDFCLVGTVCKTLGEADTDLYYDQAATTGTTTNCTHQCANTSSVIPFGSKSQIDDSKVKPTTATKLNTIEDNYCLTGTVCKDLGALYYDESKTVADITHCIHECSSGKIIQAASSTGIADAKTRGNTGTKLNTIADDYCLTDSTCKSLNLYKLGTTNECVTDQECKTANKKLFQDTSEWYCGDACSTICNGSDCNPGLFYFDNTSKICQTKPNACSSGEFFIDAQDDLYCDTTCHVDDDAMIYNSTRNVLVCQTTANTCPAESLFKFTKSGTDVKANCVPADKCTSAIIAGPDTPDTDFYRTIGTDTCIKTSCNLETNNSIVQITLEPTTEPLSCEVGCAGVLVKEADVSSIKTDFKYNYSNSTIVNLNTVSDDFCFKGAITKCRDIGAFYRNLNGSEGNRQCVTSCATTDKKLTVSDPPGNSVTEMSASSTVSIGGTDVSIKSLDDDVCIAETTTCKSLGLYLQCDSPVNKDAACAGPSKCVSEAICTAGGTHRAYTKKGDTEQYCYAYCTTPDETKFADKDQCVTFSTTKLCEDPAERIYMDAESKYYCGNPCPVDTDTLQWNSTIGVLVCETGTTCTNSSTDYTYSYTDEKACVPLASCNSTDLQLASTDYVRYYETDKTCFRTTCAAKSGKFLEVNLGTVATDIQYKCIDNCTDYMILEAAETTAGILTMDDAVETRLIALTDNTCYTDNTQCDVLGSTLNVHVASGSPAGAYTCKENCATGKIIAKGSTSKFSDTGLNNSTTINNQVCVTDAALKCKDLGDFYAKDSTFAANPANGIGECMDKTLCVLDTDVVYLAANLLNGTTKWKDAGDDVCLNGNVDCLTNAAGDVFVDMSTPDITQQSCLSVCPDTKRQVVNADGISIIKMGSTATAIPASIGDEFCFTGSEMCKDLYWNNGGSDQAFTLSVTSTATDLTAYLKPVCDKAICTTISVDSTESTDLPNYAGDNFCFDSGSCDDLNSGAVTLFTVLNKTTLPTTNRSCFKVCPAGRQKIAKTVSATIKKNLFDDSSVDAVLDANIQDKFCVAASQNCNDFSLFAQLETSDTNFTASKDCVASTSCKRFVKDSNRAQEKFCLHANTKCIDLSTKIVNIGDLTTFPFECSGTSCVRFKLEQSQATNIPDTTVFNTSEKVKDLNEDMCLTGGATCSIFGADFVTSLTQGTIEDSKPFLCKSSCTPSGTIRKISTATIDHCKAATSGHTCTTFDGIQYATGSSVKNLDNAICIENASIKCRDFGLYHRLSDNTCVTDQECKDGNKFIYDKTGGDLICYDHCPFESNNQTIKIDGNECKKFETNNCETDDNILGTKNSDMKQIHSIQQETPEVRSCISCDPATKYLDYDATNSVYLCKDNPAGTPGGTEFCPASTGHLYHAKPDTIDTSYSMFEYNICLQRSDCKDVFLEEVEASVHKTYAVGTDYTECTKTACAPGDAITQANFLRANEDSDLAEPFHCLENCKGYNLTSTIAASLTITALSDATPPASADRFKYYLDGNGANYKAINVEIASDFCISPDYKNCTDYELNYLDLTANTNYFSCSAVCTSPCTTKLTIPASEKANIADAIKFKKVDNTEIMAKNLTETYTEFYTTFEIKCSGVLNSGMPHAGTLGSGSVLCKKDCTGQKVKSVTVSSLTYATNIESIEAIKSNLLEDVCLPPGSCKSLFTDGVVLVENDTTTYASCDVKTACNGTLFLEGSMDKIPTSNQIKYDNTDKEANTITTGEDACLLSVMTCPWTDGTGATDVFTKFTGSTMKQPLECLKECSEKYVPKVEIPNIADATIYKNFANDTDIKFNEQTSTQLCIDSTSTCNAVDPTFGLDFTGSDIANIEAPLKCKKQPTSGIFVVETSELGDIAGTIQYKSKGAGSADTNVNAVGADERLFVSKCIDVGLYRRADGTCISKTKCQASDTTPNNGKIIDADQIVADDNFCVADCESSATFTGLTEVTFEYKTGECSAKFSEGCDTGTHFILREDPAKVNSYTCGECPEATYDIEFKFEYDTDTDSNSTTVEQVNICIKHGTIDLSPTPDSSFGTKNCQNRPVFNSATTTPQFKSLNSAEAKIYCYKDEATCLAEHKVANLTSYVPYIMVKDGTTPLVCTRTACSIVSPTYLLMLDLDDTATLTEPFSCAATCTDSTSRKITDTSTTTPVIKDDFKVNVQMDSGSTDEQFIKNITTDNLCIKNTTCKELGLYKISSDNICVSQAKCTADGNYIYHPADGTSEYECLTQAECEAITDSNITPEAKYFILTSTDTVKYCFSANDCNARESDSTTESVVYTPDNYSNGTGAGKRECITPASCKAKITADLGLLFNEANPSAVNSLLVAPLKLHCISHSTCYDKKGKKISTITIQNSTPQDLTYDYCVRNCSNANGRGANSNEVYLPELNNYLSGSTSTEKIATCTDIFGLTATTISPSTDYGIYTHDSADNRYANVLIASFNYAGETEKQFLVSKALCEGNYYRRVESESITPTNTSKVFKYECVKSTAGETCSKRSTSAASGDYFISYDDNTGDAITPICVSKCPADNNTLVTAPDTASTNMTCGPSATACNSGNYLLTKKNIASADVCNGKTLYNFSDFKFNGLADTDQICYTSGTQCLGCNDLVLYVDSATNDWCHTKYECNAKTTWTSTNKQFDIYSNVLGHVAGSDECLFRCSMNLIRDVAGLTTDDYDYSITKGHNSAETTAFYAQLTDITYVNSETGYRFLTLADRSELFIEIDKTTSTAAKKLFKILYNLTSSSQSCVTDFDCILRRTTTKRLTKFDSTKEVCLNVCPDGEMAVYQGLASEPTDDTLDLTETPILCENTSTCSGYYFGAGNFPLKMNNGITGLIPDSDNYCVPSTNIRTYDCEDFQFVNFTTSACYNNTDPCGGTKTCYANSSDCFTNHKADNGTEFTSLVVIDESKTCLNACPTARQFIILDNPPAQTPPCSATCTGKLLVPVKESSLQISSLDLAISTNEDEVFCYQGATCPGSVLKPYNDVTPNMCINDKIAQQKSTATQVLKYNSNEYVHKCPDGKAAQIKTDNTQVECVSIASKDNNYILFNAKNLATAVKDTDYVLIWVRPNGGELLIAEDHLYIVSKTDVSHAFKIPMIVKLARESLPTTSILELVTEDECKALSTRDKVYVKATKAGADLGISNNTSNVFCDDQCYYSNEDSNKLYMPELSTLSITSGPFEVGTLPECVANCGSSTYWALSKDHKDAQFTAKHLAVPATTHTERYCISETESTALATLKDDRIKYTHPTSDIQWVDHTDCKSLIEANETDNKTAKLISTTKTCVAKCNNGDTTYAQLTSKVQTDLIICGNCSSGTMEYTATDIQEAGADISIYGNNTLPGTDEDKYCPNFVFEECYNSKLIYEEKNSTSKKVCITDAECNGKSVNPVFYKKNGFKCVHNCSSSNLKVKYTDDTTVLECSAYSGANQLVFEITASFPTLSITSNSIDISLDVGEIYYKEEAALPSNCPTATPDVLVKYNEATTRVKCLTPDGCFKLSDKTTNTYYKIHSASGRECVSNCPANFLANYNSEDFTSLDCIADTACAADKEIASPFELSQSNVANPNGTTVTTKQIINYNYGGLSISDIRDNDDYCIVKAAETCGDLLKFETVDGADNVTKTECITEAECLDKSETTGGNNLIYKGQIKDGQNFCVASCSDTTDTCANITNSNRLLWCKAVASTNVKFKLEDFNPGIYTTLKPNLQADTDFYCQSSTTCPTDLVEKVDDPRTYACVTKPNCWLPSAANVPQTELIFGIEGNQCKSDCTEARTRMLELSSTSDYFDCIDVSTPLTTGKVFYHQVPPMNTLTVIYQGQQLNIKSTTRDFIAQTGICADMNMYLTFTDISYCFSQTRCLAHPGDATKFGYKYENNTYARHCVKTARSNDIIFPAESQNPTFTTNFYEIADRESCKQLGYDVTVVGTDASQCTHDCANFTGAHKQVEGMCMDATKCSLKANWYKIDSSNDCIELNSCLNSLNTASGKLVDDSTFCFNDAVRYPNHIQLSADQQGSTNKTLFTSTQCTNAANSNYLTIKTSKQECFSKEKCIAEGQVNFGGFDGTRNAECWGTEAKDQCIPTKQFLEEISGTSAFTCEDTLCNWTTANKLVYKDVGGTNYCFDIGAQTQAVITDTKIVRNNSFFSGSADPTYKTATSCPSGSLDLDYVNGGKTYSFCLSQMDCITINNPYEAVLYWQGNQCYQDKTFKTNTYEKFHTTNREVLAYNECVSRGLVIDPVSQICYDESIGDNCPLANRVMFADHTSNVRGTVDDFFVTFCAGAFGTGTVDTDFTSAVNSNVGYDMTSFTYNNTCYVKQNGTNWEIEKYYSTFGVITTPSRLGYSKLEAGLTAPTITGGLTCTNYFVPDAYCKEVGKVLPKTGEMSECVATCPGGKIEMTFMTVTYCISEADCFKFNGTLYSEEDTNLEKKTCVVFDPTVTAATAANVYTNQGRIINNNLCTGATPADVLYVYEKVGANYVCKRLKSSLSGNVIFIPLFDNADAVIGFWASENISEDCLSKPDFGLDGNTCVNKATCESGGKVLSYKYTGTRVTNVVCELKTACDVGFFYETVSKKCLKSCPHGQITVVETGLSECTPITGVNNAGLKSFKFLELFPGSNLQVDPATACTGGKILSSLMTTDSREFQCIAVASCSFSMDSVSGQTVCLTEQDCYDMGPFYAKVGSKCKDTLNDATLFFYETSSERFGYTNTECDGISNTFKLTSTTIATSPNKCVTAVQCHSEGLYTQASDRTCITKDTCITGTTNLIEYGTTYSCVATCSGGFVEYVIDTSNADTSKDFKQCHTEVTCKMDGFFVLDNTVIKTCHETYQSAIAADSQTICATAKGECSRGYAHCTDSAGNDIVRVPSKNICILEEYISPYFDSELFYFNGTNKYLYTHTEAKTYPESADAIDYSKRILSKLPASTDLTCSTPFHLFKTGGKQYCVNEYYCKDSTNGVGQFLVNSTGHASDGQCVDACPSDLISILNDTQGIRECITADECIKREYFLNMVAGTSVMEPTSCRQSCSTRKYTEFKDIAAKKYLVKYCFTNCSQDFKNFGSDCLRNEDCALDGSTCEKNLDGTLDTILFYPNSATSHIVTACTGPTDLKMDGFPNTCYTTAQCLLWGTIDVAWDGTNATYKCTKYCTRKYIYRKNGMEYCMDSCHGIVDYSQTSKPALDVITHRTDMLQEKCILRSECPLTDANLLLVGDVCFSASICHEGTNQTVLVAGADPSDVSCIPLNTCKCDRLDCDIMPYNNQCIKRTYCESKSGSKLSIDETGLISCVDSALNDTLISSKIGCNNIRGNTSDLFYYNTTTETNCITKAACDGLKNFVTKDHRCLTANMCNTDNLYFIYNQTAENECVTKSECEASGLTAYEESELAPGYPRTCHKCATDTFFVSPTQTTETKYDMCQATCPTGLFKRNDTKSCVLTCPRYSNEAKNECLTFCASNFVRVTGGVDYCLDSPSCPSGTFKLNFADSQLYRDHNECVDSCPGGFFIFNNTCVKCSTVLLDGKCVSGCPKYAVTNTATNSCENCLSSSKLFYNGACRTTEEVAGKILLKVDDQYNAYVDCGAESNTAIIEGDTNCYTKCPTEDMGIISGKCVRCEMTDGKYNCVIQNGKYIGQRKCSEGYVFDPRKPFMCISQSEYQEYLKTICTDKQKKDANGICQPCEKINGWYNYNGICVTACPNGTEPKTREEGKFCETCSLVFQGKCQVSCNSGFYPVNGVCTLCTSNPTTGEARRVYNGQCLPICSSTVTTNCAPSADGQCTTCTGCGAGQVVVINGETRCRCSAGFSGPNCAATTASASESIVKDATALGTSLSSWTARVETGATISNSEVNATKANIKQMFAMMPANNAELSAETLNAIVSNLEAISTLMTAVTTKSAGSTNKTPYFEQMNQLIELIDFALSEIDSYNTLTSQGRRMLQTTLTVDAYNKLRNSVIDFIKQYSAKPILATETEFLENRAFNIYFYPLTTSATDNNKTERDVDSRGLTFVQFPDCAGAKVIGAIEWLHNKAQNTTNSVEAYPFSAETRAEATCSTRLFLVDGAKLAQVNAKKEAVMNYALGDDNINILRPDQPIFTERCYSYAENGFDYTLKMRQELIYSGLEVKCGESCDFTGVNRNFKLQCSCSGNSNSAISAEKALEDDDYSGFIFEYFSCNAGFSNPDSFAAESLVLWSWVLLMLFTLVMNGYYFFSKETRRLINNNYKEVKENNCLTEGLKNKNANVPYGDRQDESGEEANQMAINIVKEERTMLDHDYTLAADALVNDSRTLLEYFGYVLKRNNVLFSWLLSNSLLKPYFIRFGELVLYLGWIMFFNSLFYFDQHVENLYDNREEDDFWKIFFSWSHGFDRVFYAMLCVLPLKAAVHYLAMPGKATITKFSAGFEREGELQKAYEQLNGESTIRYVTFFFVVLVMTIVNLYYSLIMVDFYPNSGLDWLIGVFWTVILCQVAQFFLLLIHSSIFALGRKNSGLASIFNLSRALAI